MSYEQKAAVINKSQKLIFNRVYLKAYLVCKLQLFWGNSHISVLKEKSLIPGESSYDTF